MVSALSDNPPRSSNTTKSMSVFPRCRDPANFVADVDCASAIELQHFDQFSRQYELEITQQVLGDNPLPEATDIAAWVTEHLRVVRTHILELYHEYTEPANLNGRRLLRAPDRRIQTQAVSRTSSPTLQPRDRDSQVGSLELPVTALQPRDDHGGQLVPVQTSMSRIISEADRSSSNQEAGSEQNTTSPTSPSIQATPETMQHIAGNEESGTEFNFCLHGFPYGDLVCTACMKLLFGGLDDHSVSSTQLRP